MSLDTQTGIYWRLSRARHGQDDSPTPITVEEAIKESSQALALLDPSRPLAKRIFELRHDIIYNRPAKRRAG